MNGPLVSIIVPAFNAEKYVQETLESVIGQTYGNWECIIVNDGSTDGTQAVIESFIKDDPRFTLINMKNSGVCVARNTAIDHAKGHYILPLDGDDRMDLTYVAKAVDAFTRNPGVKLVYCKAKFFGAKNEPWDLPEYNFKGLLLYNYIFCTTLFRRDDFLKTAGYDAALTHGWEDWDLWVKFLDSEDEVYRIDEFLFFYRIKKESRSTGIDNDPVKALSTRIRIYENNANKYISTYADPIAAYRELHSLRTELNMIKKSPAYRLYFFLKGLLRR